MLMIGKSSQPKAFYWSAADGMTELEFPGALSAAVPFGLTMSEKCWR